MEAPHLITAAIMKELKGDIKSCKVSVIAMLEHLEIKNFSCRSTMIVNMIPLSIR